MLPIRPLALLPMLAVSALAADPAPVPESSEMKACAQITVKKPQDRVGEHVSDSRTTYSVHSPSGIGRATIRRTSWPEQLKLRFHLRALEGLTITGGAVTFKASVLSHGGHRRLLSVVDDGKEETVKEGSPYWTEIKAFDAKGKPIVGLPSDGGYFEMALPRALLKARPKSLTIQWIDAYRN